MIDHNHYFRGWKIPANFGIEWVKWNSCEHTDIELMGRIENYLGDKSTHIYSCKKCHRTMLMNEITFSSPPNKMLHPI